MAPKIGFQALVESHEQPFVVIDKDFRIIALNQAYERAYATHTDRAIGKHCYEISHAHSRPCSEEGEECPHHLVYEKKTTHSCLHTHRDGTGRTYWVRVTAFPLITDDGEVYIGESIQELTQKDDPAETGEAVHMVGESPTFLAMIEQLQLMAQSKVPVLLMGETGTGKELAARFIHQHSDRRDKPYVTIDCTILNESLVESELFGYERGSFTGSVGSKQGLIELADGGTLFLDEIGELPANIQTKLLRVLDTGEFRRIGGQKALTADVRVVCATNRHLWEAVKEHQFREDLYYRIACMTIHLPALRERRKDIPLLADVLLHRLSRFTRRRYRLTNTALELLQSKNYPGNIRELRNDLFAASARSIDGWIDRPLLLKTFKSAQASIQNPTAADDGTKPGISLTGEDQVTSGDDAEARRIATMLKEQYGSRKRTAAALGMSTRTLYRKMKHYRLR